MFKKLVLGSVIALFALFCMIPQQSMAQMDNHEPPQFQGNMGQGGEMGQRGKRGQMGHHGKRGQMGHGKHGGGGMFKIFKQLDLTEEQKETLKQNRESAKEQMKSYREQLKVEREKMMDMMFDPNAGKDQMLAQHEKLSALKNQLAKIRVENMAQIKDILTPEQKAKLQEITAEHKQKMKERRDQKRSQFQGRGGHSQRKGGHSQGMGDQF